MGKRKPSDIPDEIVAVIKEAVNQGIAAGMKISKQERSLYQRTEARLYALLALIRNQFEGYYLLCSRNNSLKWK